jgi:hypothetical protein
MYIRYVHTCQAVALADMTSTVAGFLDQQQANTQAQDGHQGIEDAWIPHALEAAAHKSVVIGSPLSTQNDFDVQLAAASILTSDLRALVNSRLGYTVSAGALPGVLRAMQLERHSHARQTPTCRCDALPVRVTEAIDAQASHTTSF